MKRRSLILSLFAVGCFAASAMLIPGLGTAQGDKVEAPVRFLVKETQKLGAPKVEGLVGRIEAAMSSFTTNTQKLGAPKIEGKELYFGTTKADNSIVETVAKEHGGEATLFVKSGDEYVRVATTLKKEDGSSALGTVLEATSPAVTNLNKGEAYYGRNETVFGKTYVVGYEPIKDASGAVIGAYFAGQQEN